MTVPLAPSIELLVEREVAARLERLNGELGELVRRELGRQLGLLVDVEFERLGGAPRPEVVPDRGGTRARPGGAGAAVGVPGSSKRCRGCERELPVSAFGPDRRGAGGLRARCRECRSAADARRRRRRARARRGAGVSVGP